jgi:OOP family OmpA-OmpF porin
MPSVVGALRESARKDPTALSEALFPVVGPAIRRALTQYIQSLLESFNNALEHSLSLQGIRRRLEALRTGKTFAEVVLLHNLLYRVEQIFLIHDKTGLLLYHAVAPGVSVQDPALVSGMLSAIQNFVRDSFKTPGDEIIDSMRLGDLRVWVEPGPHAFLAAGIRGHPPETLRPALREALEKVHQKFGPALELFDGDSSSFEGVRDDSSAQHVPDRPTGSDSRPRTEAQHRRRGLESFSPPLMLKEIGMDLRPSQELSRNPALPLFEPGVLAPWRNR